MGSPWIERFLSHPMIGRPTYSSDGSSLDSPCMSDVRSSAQINERTTPDRAASRGFEIRNFIKFEILPVDGSGGCGYLLINYPTLELIIL